jgi:hypothetical protein
MTAPHLHDDDEKLEKKTFFEKICEVCKHYSDSDSVTVPVPGSTPVVVV